MKNNSTTDKICLIIIKDISLRKGIALTLMDIFRNVIHLDNYIDAFTTLKKKKVSLIITDLQFDTLSSSDFIRKVRTGYPGILIAAINSRYNDNTIELYAQKGVDKIFSLPLDLNVFLKEIKSLLKL